MIEIHERIEQKFPELSQAQQKVAHYLLESIEEVFSASALEIAKNADVSEATVHRLAHELGFQSFRDMKQEFGNFLKNNYRSVNNLVASTAFREENWLESHFLQEAKNVLHTGEELDQAEIMIAAEAMLQARTIWLGGWRMGLSVTSYFQFILNYMLGNSVMIPQGEAAEYASYIKEKDVVFLIAFPRYDTKVLTLAEIAREKGAYVIGLTDSPVSPIKQDSNLTLIAKSKSKGFVDSYTAAVAVCNAIINTISYVEKSRVKENIKEVEENYLKFQQKSERTKL
jgi:DNA-binding MurR/RpiR family transcriptional regulator